MEKVTRKKQHQRHKLLGFGTYGCGFYPPLPCEQQQLEQRRGSNSNSSSKNNNIKKVGKVFVRARNAATELAGTQVLLEADRKQRYFLYPVQACDVSRAAVLADGQCPHIDQAALPPRFRQLIADHGGITLKEFFKAQPLRSLRRTDVLRLLQRLFQGVRVLGRFGLAHQDIKPDNIVISAAHGPRFIDWGLMTTESRCFTSRNPMFGSPSYVYSPPELRWPYYLKQLLPQLQRAEALGPVLAGHEIRIAEQYVPRFQAYVLRRGTAWYLAQLESMADEWGTNRELVPVSAVDVYGLGVLLAWTTPWLLPEQMEGVDITRGFGDLVCDMLKPNPASRCTIVEAIKRLRELVSLELPRPLRFPQLHLHTSASNSGNSSGSGSSDGSQMDGYSWWYVDASESTTVSKSRDRSSSKGPHKVSSRSTHTLSAASKPKSKSSRKPKSRPSSLSAAAQEKNERNKRVESENTGIQKKGRKRAKTVSGVK